MSVGELLDRLEKNLEIQPVVVDPGTGGYPVLEDPESRTKTILSKIWRLQQAAEEAGELDKLVREMKGKFAVTDRMICLACDVALCGNVQGEFVKWRGAHPEAALLLEMRMREALEVVFDDLGILP